MPDPFESLRAPVIPEDPDPVFAVQLRARVERGLALPEGVRMTDIDLDIGLDDLTTVPTGGSAAVTPSGLPGVVAYLCVRDGRAALDWYEVAFGGVRRGEPIVMPDGRIGHSEIEVFGAPLFVADESPESHVAPPRPGADATVSLVAQVADVDRALSQAVTEGARVERPAANYPYGRLAVLRDPFGHRWMLESPVPTAQAATAATGPPEVLRHGDIGYVSLWVPDVERAAAFFAAALDWTYAPGSGPQGRQLEDRLPHHGMWGGQPRSTLFLCFAVDDVHEARRRVEVAGGQAEEPTIEPYGTVAMCRDNQGTPFAVFQQPAGRTPRPPMNGTKQGDLSYVTIEVPDSAAARAFYGEVLGWRFEPGHVEDGWTLVDVAPMTGLHGGDAEPTVVPMYRVDDIEAAVAQVRAAGGYSSDPERRPYGLSAQCRDDQGTRFYLGQL
jgi:predicted enzyme related to lactoylglutathione lyase